MFPDERDIAAALAAHFSIDEMSSLLQELKVKPEEVDARPATLDTFAWKITRFFERRIRLAELVAKIAEMRPGAGGLTDVRTLSSAGDKLGPTASAKRTNVFISYSHQDSNWLDKLQPTLRTLEARGHIEWWADSRIKPGMDWQHELDGALVRARAVVLLISADFLASEFIATHELPKLLDRAAREGVRILPLHVRPSLFASFPELARYRSVNPPDEPLSALTKYEAEKVLVELAETLME